MTVQEIWSASLSSYYPKAFNNEIGRSSGLLHPRCLPIRIDSGLEIRGHFGTYSSGVCSGFSPDSLFTHYLKNRGMSTKFGSKSTKLFWICKYYFNEIIEINKIGLHWKIIFRNFKSCVYQIVIMKFLDEVYSISINMIWAIMTLQNMDRGYTVA